MDEIPERLLDALTRANLTLTRRQREALSCLAAGLTEPMAADLLGIHPRVFGKHLEMARVKLGAKTSTHAVTLAIRAGLIP